MTQIKLKTSLDITLPKNNRYSSPDINEIIDAVTDIVNQYSTDVEFMGLGVSMDDTEIHFNCYISNLEVLTSDLIQYFKYATSQNKVVITTQFIWGH